VKAVDGSHCIYFFPAISGICDETTKYGVEKTIFRAELVSRKSQNGNIETSPVRFYVLAENQK
jgi:hypothetical protein